MIILDDNTPLYHGSYCEVRNPDISKCRKGKDFGRGFYLTSSKEQAVSFVKSSIVKASSAGIIDSNQNYGFVTEFMPQNIKELHVHIYQNADSEWLHCIAAHRKKDAFQAKLFFKFQVENLRNCDTILITLKRHFFKGMEE